MSVRILSCQHHRCSFGDSVNRRSGVSLNGDTREQDGRQDQRWTAHRKRLVLEIETVSLDRCASRNDVLPPEGGRRSFRSGSRSRSAAEWRTSRRPLPNSGSLEFL